MNQNLYFFKFPGKLIEMKGEIKKNDTKSMHLSVLKFSTTTKSPTEGLKI